MAGGGALAVEAGGGAQPPCRFSLGASVLAFHGPAIYEAKVIAAQYGLDAPPAKKRAKKESKSGGASAAADNGAGNGGGNRRWFVKLHWKGWSARWEQWQPEDQVLEVNPENRKLQKQTEKGLVKKGVIEQVLAKNAEEVRRNASSVAAASAPSGGAAASSPAANNKRKAEPTPAKGGDSKQGGTAKVKCSKGETPEKVNADLEVTLGQQLKKRMLDDYNRSKGTLLPLPRPHSVRDVLQAYVDTKAASRKRAEASGQPDTVGELQEGLLSYFDAALPKILLYNSERAEHAAAIDRARGGATPSDIYGAEHLLRLLVRLPDLLKYSQVEAAVAELLQASVADLLKFLHSNKGLEMFAPADKAPGKDKDKGAAAADAAV
eukprot:PRCOL_00001072-RA